MKWREPWRVSLRHQPRFNPLGKDVRTTFLWLAVTFGVLFVIISLGKDTLLWSEQLKVFPLVVLLLPALLAVFIRGTTWLSRRHISSGPRGILVSKAEDLTLVPWGAVDQYGFITVEGDAALLIIDGAGTPFPMFLPTDISRAAIERELHEKTGKHAEVMSGFTTLPSFHQSRSRRKR